MGRGNGTIQEIPGIQEVSLSTEVEGHRGTARGTDSPKAGAQGGEERIACESHHGEASHNYPGDSHTREHKGNTGHLEGDIWSTLGRHQGEGDEFPALPY
jgi:hypothetical protein